MGSMPPASGQVDNASGGFRRGFLRQRRGVGDMFGTLSSQVLPEPVSARTKFGHTLANLRRRIC
jgi:hypothetical protein